MTATPIAPPKHFVDSNIWIYAFVAGNDPDKSMRSQALLQTPGVQIVISSQVINEVCANLIRKAKTSEIIIRQLVRSFYQNYTVVALDEELHILASELREELSLSFWDSLIIAAALKSNADFLYSEDLQDGLLIHEQLRVVNPLKAVSG